MSVMQMALLSGDEPNTVAAPAAVSTTFTLASGGAAEAQLYDLNNSTSAADPAGITASTKAAYDLGSAKAVRRVTAITGAVNGFGAAVTFNIEYSDTNLTTGYSVASTIVVPSGTGQAALQTFSSVGSHRYWRINYLSGTTGGNAWLGELTMYTV